jgi:hypothetical protein
MYTPRKKLLVESADTCATLAAPLRGTWKLARYRLFEWSKEVKIIWGEVWRVRRMWKIVEGQILDCCNIWMGSIMPSIFMLLQKTSIQKYTSFGLYCRTQMIYAEMYMLCTCHDVPTGHVVLQNYYPSRRWLGAELLFLWGGMAPFLDRFLGFRLVVVDPGFISTIILPR